MTRPSRPHTSTTTSIRTSTGNRDRAAIGVRLVVPVALAVIALGGCSSAAVDDAVSTAEELASEAATVVEEGGTDVEAGAEDVVTALDDAGLTTVASAVSQIDFAAVAGTAAFTFFAPNDEAFLALTADELADLTSDVDLLTTTLQAHIVDQPVTAEELTTMSEVTTVAGTTLPVTVDGDTVTVGDATVVQTDIAVGDGVVHTIDTLLGTE